MALTELVRRPVQRAALTTSHYSGIIHRPRVRPSSNGRHQAVRRSPAVKGPVTVTRVTAATNSGEPGGATHPDFRGDSQPSCRTVNFLVLGSGIAGLTYALKVAKYGKVAVVSFRSSISICRQPVSSELARLHQEETGILQSIPKVAAPSAISDSRCQKH